MLTQDIDKCDFSGFWEIEECHTSQINLKEVECERHFKSTHQRDDDGGFVVTIPLEDSVNHLGELKPILVKRFYNLE